MNNCTDVRSRPEGDELPRMMERRRFLMLGSVAVVGAAATDLPAQILRTAWGPAQTLPLLSAGYLDGSVEGMTAASRTLVAASALRSGDASLAGSRVKLRVLDFSRTVRTTEPVSIGIDTLYRVEDRKVPHLAWSYSTSPAGESESSAARIVVPVDVSSPLELTVSKRPGRVVRSAPAFTPADFVSAFPETAEGVTTEGNGRSLAVFSLGRERTTMKLRPGVYALAFRSQAAQRTPDWRSIRFVAPKDGASPILVESTLAGVRPVSFDYLILSVERA